MIEQGEIASVRAPIIIPLLLALLLSGAAHTEEVVRVYPEDFDNLYLTVGNISDFERLDDGQRAAFCILLLEMEVNNGGFHQFFNNSTGYFVPETIMALKQIGADSTAAILEKAIVIAYPNGFPTDRSQHEEALRFDDAVFDELDEVDTAFYRYEDDLTSLVNDYLRSAP